MATNDLLPKGLVIPDHILRRSGTSVFGPEGLAGGLGGGGDYGPRISLKGSRFRIVDGESETVLDSTFINVIIVGRNPVSTKQFYAKAWAPDSEPSAPDCFSLDGVRPDAESTDKQSDLCAACPKNAWGSKVTPSGQQIKACSDEKRMAVVAAENPNGPVYLLRVTGASFKNLREYDTVLKQHGLITEGVITKISFDTNASFPKLVFAVGGFVEDDVLENTILPICVSESVKATTGETRAQPAIPNEAKKALPKPTLVQAKKTEPEPAPVAKAASGFGAPAAKAAPVDGTAKTAPAKAAPAAAVAAPSGSSDELEAQIRAMLSSGDDSDDATSSSD
jgi:hypothetical protein